MILVYILGGLALVVLLLIVVIALRPADFRIERSATMAAPATTIFPLVNDLHQWESWSPWAKLDPAMKLTFDGPPSGTGSTYHWVGNKQVGEGRMTILESRPSDFLRIRLEFLKPFQATNTTEFTFQPEAGLTRVTWTMTGVNNFILKAFGLFMNMDKLIGRDFEKGLASMKIVAEGKPH